MNTAESPRIVLITGANKGIGFETARTLTKAGHTVLLGARNVERGTAAAVELGVEFVHLDVTDTETIAAAATLVDERHGRLDILVNNAVTTPDRRYGPTEMPVAALREAYETNVLGVVAVTNAMLPLLRRSPAGYVGNVSSGLGTMAFLGDPDRDPSIAAYATLLAYNSTKAALNAVTLIYARHLRDDGIRVNALSPGFCATDLNDHTGTLTAAEGGEHIANHVLTDDGTTGAFLREVTGTVPW